MKIGKREFIPYLENEDIVWRIDAIAKKIREAYEGKPAPILLCVLNGATIFHTLLCQAIESPVLMDYIKIKSYDGLSSSGEISLVHDMTLSIDGKEVIIVEDIIDSGFSMRYLKNHLEEKGAKNIKICTLFYKPGADQCRTAIDFYGFHIPSKFIVGFGMDYNEEGRNLKDVYVLKENN